MSGDRIDNRMSGSTVHGTAVQAGSVSGGVHIHAPAPGPPAPPVPRQLRPVPATWTDREESLTALSTVFSAVPDFASPLAVIDGPGGAGKRALAHRWAHALSASYPDGQVVTDLRATAPGGPAPTTETLRSLLRVLGHAPDARLPWMQNELEAMLRSVTAGRRLLLVLEDAANAEQVIPLLPAGPNCLVVVTSRTALPGLTAHGAVHHQLRAFAPHASRALLTRILGAERAAEDPAALDRIADACGHLPRPLSLIAADLAHAPHHRLHAAAAALARPPADRTDNSTVTAADAAYRGLPDDSARVYRILAAVPAPDLDEHATAAAARLRTAEAGAHLRLLADRALLEAVGDVPGRGAVYRMPAEIRRHAQQRLAAHDGPAGAATATLSYLDYLLRTATRAEHLLAPHHRVLPRTYHHPPGEELEFTEPGAARTWMRAHLPALQPAKDAARRLRKTAYRWQITHAFGPLWQADRPVDEWIRHHEDGLRAAQRCADPMAQREMASTLALGLTYAQRYDEALEQYRLALDLARMTGDREGIAQYTAGLGSVLYDAGRLVLAEPYVTAAIDLYDGLGQPRGAALARTMGGSIAATRRDFDTAHQLLDRARRDLLALPAPDLRNAARALARSGEAHSLQGDHSPARNLLLQAREEFTAVPDGHWAARVTEYLGQAEARAGHHDRAAERYRESLDLYRALSSTRDINRLRHHLRATP
ncbi:tetratricopeptide repeat protein [Kitasatospora sp. NPDC094019]|uniref:tetratricopeptide repeat protein n=1 Tax=Kitasatospora sp. NPDC094019 TaxID=3364091 RepID=UPI0037FE37F6